MKYIISIATIVGMLGTTASAVPVSKRDLQPAPYSVISPSADTTLFVGNNTTISWVPGEEDHINISIAPISAATAQIPLAQDVSSGNGTYIISVPTVLENCAQWKIGVTHNSQSTWSNPFYISTNCTPCYTAVTPTKAAGPSASMVPMEGADPVMSASIDILGPDGQPVSQHSASSAIHRASLNAFVALALGAATIASIVAF